MTSTAFRLAAKTAAPTLHIEAIVVAAPFVMSIVILGLSVVLVPEITKRLEEHYTRGWLESEVHLVKSERTPSTHSKAAYWVVDIAQIPTIVGPPTAGLVVSHAAYSPTFLVIYTIILALGLGLFFYYNSRVAIADYWQKGIPIGPYHISPLIQGGILFNLIVGAAAILVAT